MDSISKGRIRTRLMQVFGKWLGPQSLWDHKVITVDDTYTPVSASQLAEFIKNHPLISRGKFPDNPQTFDCDDFAFYLKTQMALHAHTNGLDYPMAVGCVVMPLHTFNVIVDKVDLSYPIALVDTHAPTHDVAATKSEIQKMIQMQGKQIDLIYI